MVVYFIIEWKCALLKPNNFVSIKKTKLRVKRETKHSCSNL